MTRAKSGTESLSKAAPKRRLPSQIRRPGALLIDLVLIVVLLAMLPQTLELGEGARRFPLITVIVMLALLCLDAAIEAFPAVRRRTSFLEADYIDVHQDELLAGHEEPADEKRPQAESPSGRPLRVLNVWQAVAWLVALGIAMYILGYVVSTPIFLALFFLWARVPIKVGVGVTAVMSLLNYFVFFQYLGLQ